MTAVLPANVTLGAIMAPRSSLAVVSTSLSVIVPVMLLSGPAVAQRPATHAKIVVEALTPLRDSASHVLARPVGLVRTADGTFYVADRSDRDIKIFSPTGDRVGTAGHAGEPGGFSALGAVGLLGNRLMGFDLLPPRICQVYRMGRMGACIGLSDLGGSAPIRFATVDDSLVLVMHSVLEGAKDPLVSIADARGKRRSRFFRPATYLGGNVKLLQLSGVAADARDGVVFVVLIGADSVWAFDYEGHQLGRGRIGGLAPDSTTKALLSRNNGVDTLADGRWIVDGQRRAFSVVALDHHEALIGIGKFDGVRGLDVTKGGELALVALDAHGTIRTLDTTMVHAGLMGHDAVGALLIGSGMVPGRFVVLRATARNGRATGREP